jgi:hypothetical protein
LYLKPYLKFFFSFLNSHNIYLIINNANDSYEKFQLFRVPMQKHTKFDSPRSQFAIFLPRSYEMASMEKPRVGDLISLAQDSRKAFNSPRSASGSLGNSSSQPQLLVRAPTGYVTFNNFFFWIFKRRL